ncbi:hypothetical protein [Anthocerotibacter panamensis]|uniref:hypothetical protein n=1 Tax=Anthocerotibacter panamensis TaxID=2857077 RepID=UPI001C401499|nr:hypothetical protein [Anthocerotibacter panamensis]
MSRPDDQPRDIRLKATSMIWGFALGGLGISIPLTAVTQSGQTIPLMVLMAATISTAVVWKTTSGAGTAQLPPSSLKQIEERLSNLETIVTFEDDNLKAKIDRLRSRID